MSLIVYAPASIANIGVGFDLLGAALAPIDGTPLGDSVTVSEGFQGLQFTCTGPWKHKLPKEVSKNIVLQCAEYFLEHLPAERRPAGLNIELSKNLPVGSGLGSSASSVVAAFVALNEFFGNFVAPGHLLLMMGDFEGRVSGSVHFDNVAPAFLGGMQLMLQAAGRICESVPVFENWYWVIAYPGISLSTAEMRALLPPQYDRSVTIEYGRNLGAFIHASYRHDQQLAVSVLKDVLAEPYRSASLPGFVEARAAMTDLDMLATGISGSGPALFSVTDSLELAEKACSWLTSHYLKNSEGFTRICRIDESGARKL